MILEIEIFKTVTWSGRRILKQRCYELPLFDCSLHKMSSLDVRTDYYCTISQQVWYAGNNCFVPFWDNKISGDLLDAINNKWNYLIENNCIHTRFIFEWYEK